jgi:hypothetical protein
MFPSKDQYYVYIVSNLVYIVCRLNYHTTYTAVCTATHCHTLPYCHTLSHCHTRAPPNCPNLREFHGILGDFREFWGIYRILGDFGEFCRTVIRDDIGFYGILGDNLVYIQDFA